MTQPSSEPTPRPVAFTRTWFREGYDVAEVDAFFSRAHHALESDDGSVTEQDVHDVRFTPVRLRAGYDMDEVDRELDRIVAALHESQRPADDSAGGS